MDNCFTGRRDRSRQTSEKDVLYIIPAGPARRVHSPGGASYSLFLSRHRDVIASFSCLVLVFIYLFGILRRFQHCAGHITMGSWKGRGNQYIQFVRVL